MSHIKKTTSLISTAAVIFLALSIQHASASSSAAWEEFRQDVEQTCTKAASEKMKIESVDINPYGTESFGIAIINGFEKTTKINSR